MTMYKSTKVIWRTKALFEGTYGLNGNSIQTILEHMVCLEVKALRNCSICVNGTHTAFMVIPYAQH